MISIHYPVCRLNIRQDSEFATRYGYPKTAFKREPDMDPVSESLLSIFRGFRLLKKVADRTIIHLLFSQAFSLLYHDSKSVYGVISVP